MSKQINPLGIPGDGVQQSADRYVADTRVSGQVADNAQDWATMMSTPNRYAVLSSGDDDHGDHDAIPDQPTEIPFSAVVSRRSKRNRKERSPQATTGASAAEQPAEQPQRRRVPVLTGRSAAQDLRIAAAKKLRKKAVFYLDNISNTCTTDDVSEFVSSLSVEVLNCFAVKPRRRRGEDDVPRDHKAFRLCINADDRDRLLNATAWPDSVLFSDWYFKSAAEQQDSDKRRRVGSQSNATASATTDIIQDAPTDTVAASVVAVLRDDNSGGARMFAARGKRLCCRPRQSAVT